MNKLNSVWIFAEGTEECTILSSYAKNLSNNVTLIYVGAKEEAVGADKAYYVNRPEESVVNIAPAAAALIKENQPDLVLTYTGRNGRLAAGLIAAQLGTTVLTDLSELSVENGITGTHMVYGGVATKKEKALTASAVACVGAGLFPVAEQSPVSVIEELPVESMIRVVGKKAKEAKKTNLAAAKRIVVAGRGAANEEALVMLQALADAIGGEMGCTRPIAEEEKLMPRETYIGVSGLMLKPELYIGVGISGQVQHMVGVNNAKTIIAINKDKDAAIFKQCDFGIIGDMNAVVPALVEALK